jgi:hypothetical protein
MIANLIKNIMTTEVSQELIKKWFWTFATKLTEDYPEYRTIFDNIVSTSYNNDLLWEVMEFAYRHLEVDAELKGGMDNLMVYDYLTALEYGYVEWVK